MKILVDQLPTTPAECPFVTWNCEYGYVCKFKIGKLRNREIVFCKDTAKCPWLKGPTEANKEAPITNYDLLISKTPEELACWIAQILMYCVNRAQLGKTDCSKNCPLYKCCNNCPTDSIEEWLLNPADKETDE